MARRHIIRPSTRAFAREGLRTPGYSFFDWLHGYVYARWPYLYIGIGTGEHPLAWVAKPAVTWLRNRLTTPPTGDRPAQPTLAEKYHGKVVPLGAATQLVSVNEEINLRDLEQIIPYEHARDIVLKNPNHIVALECPCRCSRADPCLPLDVCLIVGEPFASLVAEHHAKRSRWITQSEAADILRDEDKRGHVHHAFFKDAMLGRFYAICNCCSCCCGAMQLHSSGIPMLASSGYVCSVDSSLCVGCGACADQCQFGALSVSGSGAVIQEDLCMGCGVCASGCPSGALSLRREPSRGAPLEIRELLKQPESTNQPIAMVAP